MTTACALGLARQSVQRVAEALERDGLAVYAEGPSHRRSKLLRRMRRGPCALRTIQAAQQGWADVLGAEIGAADLQQASLVLARVVRAVMSRRPRAVIGE